MAWTLRSGRVLTIEREDAGDMFLGHEFLCNDPGHPIMPMRSLCWDEERPVIPGLNDGAPQLTADERRELADAAKEAWDKWAETGEL